MALKYRARYPSMNARGKFMPLILKRLLHAKNLTQTDWCKCVKRSDGRNISASQANQILNWGSWPKETSRVSIEQQTRKFLLDNGFDDSEIRDCWEIDKEGEELYGRIPSAREGVVKGQHVVIKPDPTRGSPFKHDIPENVMLKQSAKKHFNIFRDPFIDDIEGPEDLFLNAEHAYVRRAMHQCAKSSGFTAVVGESGAGKSTLRRDLINSILNSEEKITIIQPQMFDKSRLSTGAICDAIIADISSQRPKNSLEAKARQIERLLKESSRAGYRHVLIIEEAHDLSIKTLKYLKRFWEMSDGFRKLLGILLIGQPEIMRLLDERVAWEAREVIRRIEIVTLEPLNQSLEGYLELKFKKIGLSLDKVFTPDAFDAIRDRLTLLRTRNGNATESMSYPLVVNNTVRKALNQAADLGEPLFSGELVRSI